MSIVGIELCVDALRDSVSIIVSGSVCVGYLTDVVTCGEVVELVAFLGNVAFKGKKGQRIVTVLKCVMVVGMGSGVFVTDVVQSRPVDVVQSGVLDEEAPGEDEEAPGAEVFVASSEPCVLLDSVRSWSDVESPSAEVDVVSLGLWVLLSVCSLDEEVESPSGAVVILVVV
ncbi:unnamed protein product [Clonostachys rosea f. rosea IK726]|uniref:Uncharacterized protein n=1 Tax=Clonostachys rosea f. rosea IK726 TaxID=1349383 RepID=A0ACA9TEV6_BIOOC|nr:unnamed protein product [Clonostachys rosea f. rosea IK726]